MLSPFLGRVWLEKSPDCVDIRSDEGMLEGSSQDVNNTGSTSRRLERAREHVERMWFPVNMALLEKIKQGFKEGLYDLDVDFLIVELKSDFSLFAFCLKNLLTQIREKKIAPPPADMLDNPVGLLRWAGVATLRKLLETDPKKISIHSLTETTEFQSSCLKEAMISSSTAELMAGNELLGSELGFACGVMRQLGLTLIAWNYPTVYRKALAAATETQHSIDEVLSQLLGFSPLLLANTLATSWGLKSELVDGDGKPDTPPSHLQSVATRLHHICEVGEALARASHPEIHPGAAKDWDMARTEIEHNLGEQALKIITEKVRDNCESYFNAYPELFHDLDEIDPEARIVVVRQRRSQKRNPFLKNCAPALRKVIENLYADIEEGPVSRENISSLVRDIIPLAGFSGGCIYTLDPGTMTLSPRLKIGLLAKNDIKPVLYKPNTPSDDPIISAFQCQTPVIEDASLDLSNDLTLIAGALGDRQRTGVLYLEAPAFLHDDGESLMLLHFKAVRQALQDVLRLT